MHMYEDWIQSKGTTELLTSRVCEGGPWQCELLVFNSFVGCISPGSYGLLIIASWYKSSFSFFFFFHKKLTRKMEEQDYEECSIFCSFFLGLTVSWSFDFYGVLLVCNLYHIGIHTVDISGRKAVVSNTKWKSLGKLGCYHWWIIFVECN